MDYLIIFIADILLALSFAFQKKYQIAEGAGVRAGLKFNLVCGFSEAILFLCFLGFQPDFSLFSLCCALIASICLILYLLFGFVILRDGNTALYSLFLMCGGMILPYLFGIIVLNENVTALRIIGTIIIVSAVFLSSQTKVKFSWKSLLFCIAVFILNGFVSIISKVHQLNIDAVNSMSFVVYSGLCKCILSAIVLLLIKSKKKSPNATRKFFEQRKIFMLIFIAAAIGGISYLLQLMGAKTVPASVLYPLITGGSIIFSALTGKIILKEKLSKLTIISIVLCFIGTLLFL